MTPEFSISAPYYQARDAYQLAIATGKAYKPDGTTIMSLSEWLDSRPGTGGTGGVSSYNDLTDVPTEFPPSAHGHIFADISDGGEAIDAKLTSLGLRQWRGWSGVNDIDISASFSAPLTVPVATCSVPWATLIPPDSGQARFWMVRGTMQIYGSYGVTYAEGESAKIGFGGPNSNSASDILIPFTASCSSSNHRFQMPFSIITELNGFSFVRGCYNQMYGNAWAFPSIDNGSVVSQHTAFSFPSDSIPLVELSQNSEFLVPDDDNLANLSLRLHFPQSQIEPGGKLQVIYDLELVQLTDVPVL